METVRISGHHLHNPLTRAVIYGLEDLFDARSHISELHGARFAVEEYRTVSKILGKSVLVQIVEGAESICRWCEKPGRGSCELGSGDADKVEYIKSFNREFAKLYGLEVGRVYEAREVVKNLRMVAEREDMRNPVKLLRLQYEAGERVRHFAQKFRSSCH